MSDPPRRARFQIHLSTALVMMVVAGGVLGVNLVPRVTPRSLPERDLLWFRIMMKEENEEQSPDDSLKFEDVTWGWPLGAYCLWRVRVLPTHSYYKTTDTFAWWNTWHVAADAGVALAIVLGVGVVFEWLVRRRAARQGA